ncbi:YHYH protein [Thalassomonas viridans]|uniref:YHYH protein n=1 Tax=Thalassomonas viridans TaxID=137584 RepID=A0AAE9Z5S3_9GAMM|nr:YHYH protein [Thalassomonas viridans]WDE05657.1 YHYH protein [Thalassomonas viridans]
MKFNLLTAGCLLALTHLAQAFVPEPPPKPRGPGGQPPQQAIAICQDQAEFSQCQMSRGDRTETGYCEYTPDRKYFACNPNSRGPGTETGGSEASNIGVDNIEDTTKREACQQITDSVAAGGFNGVSVNCDNEYAYIISDTYPDHDLMNGITGTNEQIPVPVVNYAAPVKLTPQLASSLTTIDAAVGVAVNGVPIYDYSAQGELDVYNYDANADTLVLGQLDNCGGHAGRGDDYHYHVAPNCMIDAMPNKADDTVIGWGYDGYPLYGNNNPDGSAIEAGTLDVCNGQADESFGYRYHTSVTPPYIIQCLVGEVDTGILPRVSPLSGDTTGARAHLTPPQDGVENLSHVIGEDGSRTMRYDYRGENYYVSYRPSAGTANCYDFEQKTVSNGGLIETGTYCR